MKIQHLVLDNDVHKALKARKKQVGITVKEIGNSALRAALLVPTKQELIAQKLVETGKITREEYDRAVAAATRSLKSGRAAARQPIVPPLDGTTVTVGSWKGAMIHRDPQGMYVLFAHEAADGKKTPSTLHDHSEAQSWAVVLQGKVRWRIGAEERVCGPGEPVLIPPGVLHNSAPLTRNTVMLMLMSPPESQSRDTLGAPKKASRARASRGGAR